MDRTGNTSRWHRVARFGAAVILSWCCGQLAHAQSCSLSANPLKVPAGGGLVTFGISCTNLTPFTQYYQTIYANGTPFQTGNGPLAVSDASGTLAVNPVNSVFFQPNPYSNENVAAFYALVCRNSVCIPDTAVAMTNSVTVIQAGLLPSIVYYIELPGALIGTITTDGTIGTLSPGNILAWNLTATLANAAGGPPRTFYFNSAFPSTGTQVVCGQAGCGVTSPQTLTFPGASLLQLGFVDPNDISFSSNGVQVASAGGSGNVVTGPVTLTNQPGPDFNQYGLTGSWYEMVSSGQGLEFEISPDNPATGTATIFASWFTFDTAAGAADHQRWYTALGQVSAGASSATLPIYQNTGGNFNAAPATTSQRVGTATLVFFTCTSGQVEYAFNNGTSGFITFTRLLHSVTCETTTPYPANADFAHSGNWFDPATSGQGFTIEVNPGSPYLFAAWYTYEPSGTAAGAAGQRWYTAQAGFTAGMRSIPVMIYETTGGIFDTPAPAGQQTVVVGSGTLAFQSCTAATFSYNFTGGTSSGLTGTINLARLLPVPQGCI